MTHKGRATSLEIEKLVEMAFEYEEEGDVEKMLSCWNKVMDLDDTHSGSRYALGEYYWELEDYSKSLVYYSKAIEIDSEFAAAIKMRGRVYWCLDHTQEALDDMLRAIELGECDPDDLDLIANLFIRLGDPHQAIKYCNLAIEWSVNEPNDWNSEEFLLTKSLAFIEIGDKKSAKNFFRLSKEAALRTWKSIQSKSGSSGVMECYEDEVKKLSVDLSDIDSSFSHWTSGINKDQGISSK